MSDPVGPFECRIVEMRQAPSQSPYLRISTVFLNKWKQYDMTDNSKEMKQIFLGEELFNKWC